MAKKVVRGDDVQVIAGDHKGKVGKVLRVVDDGTRVLVAGVNIGKKMIRKKTGKQVVDVEFPIHVSNVMLVDKKRSCRSRVGFVLLDGVKKRIYKGSGEVVN